ncbi:FAD-dependent oxidoreductase [Opitutales bacterium]|nr:FAD-dependent oxidoreductase [Opitutales bacterium]
MNQYSKRREFLRVIGGVGVTSLLSPSYLMGARPSSALSRSGVLVEASGFAELGGWKLDTQHYLQMGGNYLLAHGMGQPVQDAITTVSLPLAGSWHLWVRNRDWCKGDWESPGRFQVWVDGKPVKETFGQTDESWHWQKGGSIDIKKAGDIKVALKDLTGFDGRCDALYFTQETNPVLPSKDLKELSDWKDEVSGRAKEKIEEFSFDVVIVGGGMTGCGAALAARSQGLKVALIQDRPLFGGNASEEVRVHSLGIHGYGTKILKKIDTAHYPNGHAKAKNDQEKREQAMAQSGVDLFAHHLACGLEKEGNQIVSVEAREVNSGRIKRFSAPSFIDATGDGWLGYWAGADYRYGREAASEHNEGWDKYGDLWSPEKPDNRVMGTSVLWNSVRSKTKQDFPKVPWALPVAGNHAAINGEWYWEYSENKLNQIDDAEAIRDHMLRAIFGSFSNAKKNPKYAPNRLAWVAYVGGKRESRRIMGDHIYDMHDAVERREFSDAVVVEKREVDGHFQRKLKGSKQDFLSAAMFRHTGGHYYIPFRSFYSRNLTNLMMAGRCFSCTHVGLCGPRVMNTCGQMGIATGLAAALCKKHNANPREIGKSHISELRKLIGFDGSKPLGNPSKPGH